MTILSAEPQVYSETVAMDPVSNPIRIIFFISRTIFSWITQILVWFIIAPLYLLLFKIKVNGREHLKGIKGPMVIATNHIEWHDPWFIRFVLGFNSPLLPIRFMGTKIFINQFTQFLYYIGLIPLVYFLFGTFTIEQGKGLSVNLANARNILKRGGVVVIFPEGRMNKVGSNGAFLPFKKGAAALAISEGVSILPIHIKRKYNNAAKGVAGWRDELTASVGEVFRIAKDKTFEEGTRVLEGVFAKS